MTHARPGARRSVAMDVGHVVSVIIAASSSQSHDALAPRRASGLSALRKMMVRSPSRRSSLSDLFHDTAMPADATRLSMVSMAPSLSIGYVGAMMRPKDLSGCRNASTAPALVLPEPRPPMNIRNRALSLQKRCWALVCVVWCIVTGGQAEVDCVVGRSAGRSDIVGFPIAGVKLLE